MVWKHLDFYMLLDLPIQIF